MNDLEGRFRFDPHGQDYYPYLGKRVDFGFQAGVGAMFFEKIILDIRYSQGMEEFMYYVEKDESYKNKVIQINIDVPIALNRGS